MGNVSYGTQLESHLCASKVSDKQDCKRLLVGCSKTCTDCLASHNFGQLSAPFTGLIVSANAVQRPSSRGRDSYYPARVMKAAACTRGHTIQELVLLLQDYMMCHAFSLLNASSQKEAADSHRAEPSLKGQNVPRHASMSGCDR